MNNQPQPVCYDEDEIDLRELFKTVARYKKFIIIFTLLATLTAAVYAFLKKPVYESTAIIQAGWIDYNTNLPNKKSKIYAYDPQAIVEYINNNITNVSAQLVKKTEDIIKMSAQALSQQEATHFLQKALEEIEKKDAQKRALYIENLQAQIEVLLTRKKAVQNEKKALMQQLNRLRDAKAKTLIAANIQRFDSELLELDLKLAKLQGEIKLINANKMSLLGKIHQNGQIKPKKKLIIIVAFVTGLILSIFLVFFIEFIKSMKEEENAQQAKE